MDMQDKVLGIIRQAIKDQQTDANYSLLGVEYIIDARLREYWMNQLVENVTLDDDVDSRVGELVLSVFNKILS